MLSRAIIGLRGACGAASAFPKLSIVYVNIEQQIGPRQCSVAVRWWSSVDVHGCDLPTAPKI